MKMKLLAATAIAAVMAMGASAAVTTNIIEQWTFDSPSNGTGINGTIIDTWAATATGNSDLGGGVLRYGNTADSNWGNSELLPDIDTSAIDKMIWTIELADLKVSAGSHFRFSTITSGTDPELELTAFGAGVPYTFSPDMEYNLDTDKLDAASGISLNATNGTLGGPLTIVATWDFVNNTMTLDMGGGNVSSNTPAANMATAIGTVTGFRMYPRTIVAGDYLDLDTVTIEIVEPAAEPPPPLEGVVEQWTFDGPDTQTGTNGTIVTLWSNVAPNSASGGVLTYATSGDADWGSGQFASAIDATAISNVIMTIDATDLLIGYTNGVDQIRFQLITDAGELELELNAWSSGQLAPDLEQGLDATDDLDVTILNQNDYAGQEIPLVMICNWDFINNTMSLETSGSVATTNSASATNLVNVTQITGFRVRTTNPFNNPSTFMDLDTVTIQAIEKPVVPVEFVTVEQWNFDGADTAEGVNGLIVSTFSNTPPNSVPSAGILRLETPGSSLGDGFDGLKAASIKKLVMEVDLADFLIGVGTTDGVPNNTGVDIMSHELITDAGQLKLELNAFGANGSFAPDMEQGLGSTDDLDVTLLTWAEQTNESPMILTCTWDFENLEMTLETSGAATSSTTVPATNLANIVNIWRYRTTSSTSLQYGSFQELNSVTIKTESYYEQGTYEYWLFTHYDVGSATNKTDNPDGDALNNLYEYGLGGNPGVADSGIEGTFQQAGSNMEYVHVQRNDDASLVYSLAITDDLVGGIWTNAGYTVTGTNTSYGVAGFDTVTNSIPIDDPAKFIRLIIE